MATASIGDLAPALLSAVLSTAAGVALSAPRSLLASHLRPALAEGALFLAEAAALIVLMRLQHVRHAAAQRAAEQARAAARAREELIAKVGHEWRTPLNTIAGWSHQLVERRDNADFVARAAASISRAAGTASRLVEDLLDQSRASRGMLSIVPKRIVIADPIRAALEGVADLAAKKGVRLETSAIDPQARVWGDATRLEQVFANLLHNAVKFTPGGGVVRISALHVGNVVKVRVVDTGVGLDPADIPRMFKPFEQADSVHDSRLGGLGLGLAIARQLVVLHGGWLDATSEGRGCGSTFVVRLPAATTDRPTAVSHDTVSSNA